MQEKWSGDLSGDLRRLPRNFFTRDGISLAKGLLGKVLVHETDLGLVRGIITETESYMGAEDRGAHSYGGRRTARTEPMFHLGGTSYVYLIYGMYRCMNIVASLVDVPQAVLLRSVVPADEISQERMLRLRIREAEKKNRRRIARSVGEAPGVPGGEAAKSAAGRSVGEVPEGSEYMAARSVGEASGVPGGEAAKSAAGRSVGEVPEGSEYMAARSVGGVPEVPGGEAARSEAGRSLGLSGKGIASISAHLADGPGKLCIAMGIGMEENDLDLVESPGFYVTEGLMILPEQIHAGKRIGIDYAGEAADYLWRFYL